MALTMTTADAVLKDVYMDLREQINQKFLILQQIEQNTKDFEGRKAVHAIHVSRNSGVGARADGGSLPTAGQQGYTTVNVPVRYNYGRIQLNGPTIRAMKSDRGSFLRAVKGEMNGCKRDVSRDVNRQIWGTSDGVIAATSTSSNTTTINMASTTTPTQFRQLYADGGMIVDIGTVASPTAVVSGVTVSAVDSSALTITVSGSAITTNSTHRVFRSGNGGATDGSGAPGDGQLEYTGLQSIVDNASNLHTVSYTTYPTWNSTVDSNLGTNRAVGENLINKNIQAVDIAGDNQVNALIGSDGVSRAVANLMTSMRRNVDNVDLKGGYRGIEWTTPVEGMGRTGPIALTYDRDCPENQLFGLSWGALVHYVQSDWEWMQDDGAVLSRVSGYDAYEAVLFKYAELACRDRNAHFVIQDLTQA